MKGVIGPYFFRVDRENSTTVTPARYGNMLETFVADRLQNILDLHTHPSQWQLFDSLALAISILEILSLSLFRDYYETLCSASPPPLEGATGAVIGRGRLLVQPRWKQKKKKKETNAMLSYGN
ncbi:hypothetical protein Trydic_g19295 [Trypoxylus dichotomus]